MTTAPSTEIQQLQQLIKDGFNELKVDINQLDRKIDDKFNELKLELKEDINRVDKGVIKLESALQGMDKRISNLESSVQKIPEIAEKFGELKNWRQIAFIIIAAVVGWFARGGRI